MIFGALALLHSIAVAFYKCYLNILKHGDQFRGGTAKAYDSQHFY